MVQLIEVLIHIAVPLVAFTAGLAATADLRWLSKQPGLLIRSLLAVLVLVPAAAIILVRTVELPRVVAAGLLVVAVSIGPVSALQKSRKRGGEERYAIGLDVLLLVLSLVYVPLAAAVIGNLFGREIQLDVATVAKVILPMQLLPLLAGLLVRRSSPQAADKIVRPLTLVADLLLGAVALGVLLAMFKPIAAIGARGLVALIAFAITAVVIGHLLAGEPEHRPVLASFSAMRFPALAIALASLTRPGRDVIPVVVAYLVISGAVLTLYAGILELWNRSHHPGGSRAAPSR